LALWTISNILLVSNLKDGLCLPPLEFTIIKKFTNKFDDSLMLISEFSGANRAFTGFLEFNPFNVRTFKLILKIFV
jgi:trehalose-6-phosphate synthase